MSDSKLFANIIVYENWAKNHLNPDKNTMKLKFGPVANSIQSYQKKSTSHRILGTSFLVYNGSHNWQVKILLSPKNILIYIIEKKFCLEHFFLKNYILKTTLFDIVTRAAKIIKSDLRVPICNKSDYLLIEKMNDIDHSKW